MMDWQYNPYVLPLFLAVAVSAALALFAWRRHPTPGATASALLMLAAAEWSLGYALELGISDLPTRLFWAKAQYLGIVMVPVAWLVLVLQYTGRERWLTRRNLVLLVIEPLVTLLLVWTNEVHGLIYSNTRLDTSGSFSMLSLTFGSWFWVDVAYSYLLLVLSVLLLIRAFIHSPHLYRRQVGALLVGAFAPWVAEVLSISGLSPFPVDMTCFAFTFTGLAAAWGLFRFRLLDIVPVARDAVIEDMSDGVIVLDAQNRIVDLNPAAERIIGRPASEAIGQPIHIAGFGLLTADLEVQGFHSEIVRPSAHDEVHISQSTMTFDLRISPLHDRRGHLTGRLVVLRDITERVRVEQELKKYRDHLEELVKTRTAELQQEITERKRAEEELRQNLEKSRRALEGTVQTLVSTIEMRDPYTAGHQRRVTQLACAIAQEMGFPEEQIEGLRMAGLIHDIGKISVPAQILSKPGPLTDLEYGLIKAHSQVGYNVLNGAIDFPWPVAETVLQHHERMDGSGYPQGLSGDDIIMEARILGVADVVEAMASHRPYRAARGIDKALEEISQNRGILYDSEVVDACMKLFTEKGFTF